MTTRIQFPLVIAVMLCASVVQAKTATEVFEKVSPSVVVIKTYDAKGQDKMLGSGVILDAGVVVTNCHVVKEAATMQVVYKETKYPATLRHSDWDRDICSLAVDGLKGLAATKGSTSRLKVGDKVYAVGAPQGLELTLSDGLISSLRPVTGGQYLQITAPISPGSSGGGLFDDEGRLIGLPTFYLTEGQQLNFAVPVEWTNELFKRTAPASKIEKTTSVEWLNKAVELEGKKDWPGLLKHALLWTKALPEDAFAWVALGVAYDKSGQTAKEIEAYQQALRINPENADTWTLLGITYKQSGQTAKAIEAYQKAVQINPENARSWYNLGIALWNSAKAIEAFQQALRINPEHASSWYNLGINYRKSGQTAKAIDAYQQALRIDPEDADAWFGLGKAYQESGQTAKAIEAFQQALRIDPEDANSWYNLGVSYGKSGQTDKAIDAYQQALRIDPEDADAWSDLGDAYSESGQTEKEIEAYQQAIRIDPENLFSDLRLARLGIAYGKSGQTAKAIEAFQQALRIRPEYARLWVCLGIAYKQSGQTSQVMEVYKRLKTLDPAEADQFFNENVLP